MARMFKEMILKILEHDQELRKSESQNQNKEL